MAASRNAVAESVGKLLSWYRQRKTSARREFVWNTLAELKPNQQLTTAQLFGSFRMQVASTLFSDQLQMEQTLRCMLVDGVAEFDEVTQGWRLAKHPLYPALGVKTPPLMGLPGQRPRTS
jgi:hypothetical protein